MQYARCPPLRVIKSELVGTCSDRVSHEVEVFRAPSLTSSDGSLAACTIKAPPSSRESLYRRDSLNSLCSTPSDASSRLPQGAGRLFTCDDEDGEQFSNLYLNELKDGSLLWFLTFQRLFTLFFDRKVQSRRSDCSPQRTAAPEHDATTSHAFRVSSRDERRTPAFLSAGRRDKAWN